MTDDERDIVRRCRRGDSAAMRQLVERFQADVFGLCVRLLNHRHDAEDVAQEVFLRVFRSLHRWDATRPLRPWVLAIAVNRCRTALSRRVRRPELVDHLHDTLAAPPEDDSAELRAALTDAVADLRDEYRTAFVLYHEQGCSYDDIAVVLARPVGTVKTWLHRARLELLARLRRSGLVSDDADRAVPEGIP